MVSGFRRELYKTALFRAVTQRVVVIRTEVSGQPIGPIFKGKESKKLFGFFTLVPKIR